MSSLEAFLSSLSAVKLWGGGSGVSDDDVVDRLNHQVMPGLLFLLSVATLLKSYMGSAVNCWIPAEYKDDQFTDYVNSYCWVHPMYSVPMEDAIPSETESRYFNSLGYYRWVTVFFIVQALLFKFPRLIWNVLKAVSCEHWDKINRQASEASSTFGEKRKDAVKLVARLMDLWLNSTALRTKNPAKRFLQQSRCGIIASYELVKVLCIVNICCQIAMVGSFLNMNFIEFGASAFSGYFLDGGWEDIYNFPRIAYCDLQIRQMTNVLGYTVQCVLSLNLFLEKMFFFLWFLFLFLFIATTVSLIKWTWMFININQRSKSYLRYSSFSHLTSAEERKKYQSFFKSYLGKDGYFLIKTLANNTSEMHVTELLHEVYLLHHKPEQN